MITQSILILWGYCKETMLKSTSLRIKVLMDENICIKMIQMIPFGATHFGRWVELRSLHLLLLRLSRFTITIPLDITKGSPRPWVSPNKWPLCLLQSCIVILLYILQIQEEREYVKSQVVILSKSINQVKTEGPISGSTISKLGLGYSFSLEEINEKISTYFRFQHGLQ